MKDNLEDQDLILLDASQQINQTNVIPEYLGIQIPGTRYFDIKMILAIAEIHYQPIPCPEQFEQAAQKLGINTSSKIIVYDSLGIYSSPRAWWLFQIMGHKMYGYLMADFLHGESSCSKDEIYQSGNFKSNFNGNGEIYRRYPKKYR
jgi:thiosulfate/3-mercaptopyruvate sulfurtransferase